MLSFYLNISYNFSMLIGHVILKTSFWDQSSVSHKGKPLLNSCDEFLGSCCYMEEESCFCFRQKLFVKVRFNLKGITFKWYCLFLSEKAARIWRGLRELKVVTICWSNTSVYDRMLQLNVGLTTIGINSNWKYWKRKPRRKYYTEW